MSKLNFIANIKQFRSDLGKMTRIGQLIDYIPYSSAEKVAVWMLTAVVISPLYILIRSIFLKYHEKFYFLDNQFTLGSYWVSLLQEIGYLGLLLLLFVFMKSIRKCRNDGIGFKQYLLGHLFQVFLLLLKKTIS